MARCRRADALLLVIPAQVGLRRSASVSSAELPPGCAGRVTFLAGAKKVTKETPRESEHPQVICTRNLRRGTHNASAIRRFRVCGSLQSDKAGTLERSNIEMNPRFRGNGVKQHERGAWRTRAQLLAAATCPWNCVSTRRSHSRVSEGCSDCKRCFFGNFLCTSKESYPLARRGSGSSCPSRRVSQKIQRIPRFAGNRVPKGAIGVSRSETVDSPPPRAPRCRSAGQAPRRRADRRGRCRSIPA